MTILLGVDGTGPESNAQYAIDFANSFVHRIWRQSRCRERAYLPGPAALGGATLGLAQRGHRWLMRNREGDEPVLLTGYSRGAAIVVYVAQLLQEQGVPVAAMMLFDCVDRAIDIDAERIPTNVVDVLHVRRHWESGSRESFGNAGALHSSPTRYRQNFFMGTHGAIGGCPWRPDGGAAHNHWKVWEGVPDGMTNITFAQDQECARDVWDWVHPYLVRMHFIG